MKAFARFKNETWCMDLAYKEKLAKDEDVVKYLPVPQDLFDRTVAAKGIKTKESKETVRTFFTMITKKNQLKKNWVDKGTDFAGELKKFCESEGKQIYSTICETYAAFAERRIRSLKKNNLPLYGRLRIQVHSQIVSIRQNPDFQKFSDRLDTKLYPNFRLFVHSVQQASTRTRKTQN